MILDRKAILAAVDLKKEEIEVPEWGGSVLISTMSAAARDAFEASIAKVGGGISTQNIRAKLAVACIVGEDGQPLFTEADLVALGKKSCAALDRVFAASQRLNLVSNSDVENLAKN